ncbi:hypothetical protein CCAX7_41870 [Capsulimonas corticalis]|uniref:Uncharacterized protein n=1 Tax=Capsulimonas corticalis TaxID=2219043 RepID=A0A402CXZ9_9BACT|nr:hypothetical protein CCAX7_41870 [Capsulimonas corticalis]
MFVASFFFWTLMGFVLGLVMGAVPVGIAIGVIVGVVNWFVCTWSSEKFAIDLYDAELLDSEKAPGMNDMIRELSRDIGIDAPLLYAIPISAPNAFVVPRRDRGNVVVVTNGLTKHLNREEVQAVVTLMLIRLADKEAPSWSVASAIAGLPIYVACTGDWKNVLRKKLAVDRKTGLTIVERVMMAFLIVPCAIVLRIGYDHQSIAGADRATARLLGTHRDLYSALAKMEEHLPKTWWGRSYFNAATAPLFAIEPLASPETIAGLAPIWRFSQHLFGNMILSPSERRRLLSEAPVAEPLSGESVHV